MVLGLNPFKSLLKLFSLVVAPVSVACTEHGLLRWNFHYSASQSSLMYLLLILSSASTSIVLFYFNQAKAKAAKADLLKEQVGQLQSQTALDS